MEEKIKKDENKCTCDENKCHDEKCECDSNCSCGDDGKCQNSNDEKCCCQNECHCEEEDKQHGNEKRIYKIKLEKKDQEIEKTKADLEHWKNEYYRSYADLQNLRKAIEKEHQEAMKYRAEGFVDKLLPVLDGFHMALLKEPNSPDLKNYLIGFQYIYNSLLQALESEGVSEISPKVGDKFNEKFMHAIDSIEQDGEENLIVSVYAKGYNLKDHLIRPAMVVVSKHKALKEEKVDEKSHKEE